MMISWTGFHQLIRPRPSVPRLVHDFIRNLGVPKIAKHCSFFQKKNCKTVKNIAVPLILLEEHDVGVRLLCRPAAL